MVEEKDASEHLALLEAYKEQLETLEQQSVYIQALITEYTKARITMEQLSNIKDGVEILMPIGGGVFVPAESKDTSKVLLAEGADIVVEKSIDEAVRSMNKRIEELQNNLVKLDEMAQQIQQKAQEISMALQDMFKEKK